ncbi:hypothetical protein M5K25_015110 [Dendrobium thyrsiflorum]|uniref:Uncharacterized protein n=1 Tax=Dendrobium thyrsiflorum TaxID=117978 RepID=A0ABD0UPD3_DENTH
MDSANKVVGSTGSSSNKPNWKLKPVVIAALTLLTSSQSILIVWSKRAGKYEYSVTTANFSVEALKCALSLAALFRIWKTEGVTENNRLSTSFDEVSVYPIPAALYLIKNLLQILKNLNIITTGVLYRLILKRKLSQIQWAAFILLCAGCTTTQLNSSSDRVLQTSLPGWLMAVVMALLSGFAGVYTEDFDAVVNNGIAVSMVMKFADNIVKVYATSVAMLLTGIVSVFLFGFNLSLAFFLGTTVVSLSVYLHYIGSFAKLQAMLAQIRTERVQT